MLFRLVGVVMVILAVVMGKDVLYPLWSLRMSLSTFSWFETTTLLLIAGSIAVLVVGLFGLKLLFGRKI